MKITTIICLIIYTSIIKLHSQNNYIDAILLPKKVPKSSYVTKDFKNFWYFVDKFKADTLMLSSAINITVNWKKIPNYNVNFIPVCFTGYLDIKYQNRVYAEMCYERFSAVFRKKIIDKDKSSEPYGGIFRYFGLVISLHKDKPIIRLYRFTGAVQGKLFFSKLINQLRKKTEFSAFYAIPGGRDDSFGCVEIIIK
jgi:hypothetical protein